jgi:glycosyltransferase involved in cell wall biosynthesis
MGKVDCEVDSILKEIEFLKPSIHFVRIFELRKRLYEISPMCHQNSLEYIRLLSRFHFNEAISILEIMLFTVEDPGNDLRYRLLYSEILEKNKNINEALNVLELAQELHPHNLWPYIQKSMLIASNGAVQEGLKLLIYASEKFGNEDNSLHFFRTYANILELGKKNINYLVTEVIEGNAIYNVLLCFLVKDEGDIIRQNLEHHYKVGFRNFVVMNNNSTDETRNLILAFRKNFPDAFVLLLDDEILGHNQGVKTNAMAKYACSMFELIGRKIDWCLPIDGDEFFFPGTDQDMATIFARAEELEALIISFVWQNAATSDIFSPIKPDDDILTRFNLRLEVAHLNVFKVAIKMGNDDEFVQGNHATIKSYLNLNKIIAASDMGGFVLHLHMRNFDHTKRKVINGGQAALAANIDIAGHWKNWYQQFLNKGDDAIYEILENYRRPFLEKGIDVLHNEDDISL